MIDLNTTYSTDGGKTWKDGNAKVVSWKTFRHWRKMAMAGYGILATAIVLGLFANTHLLSENHKTVKYLCSTTSTLDHLVVSAEKQLKVNFDNGTYARLLKSGLLTQENVKAAREAIAAYKASHIVLIHNKSCRQ